VQRQALVVDRTGGAGQVENVIDRLGDLDVVCEIVIQEEKGLVSDLVDVLEVAGVQVVDADRRGCLSPAAPRRDATRETQLRLLQPPSARADHNHAGG